MEPTGQIIERWLAGVELKLPEMLTEGGMKIQFFNIGRHPQLIPVAAQKLAEKIKDAGLAPEFVVTVDSKGPLIARPVADILNVPLFIIYKGARDFFVGDPIRAVVQPITAAEPVTLCLNFPDALAMMGMQGVMVDDVISTGESVRGVEEIARKARFKILKVAVVFREGVDCRAWLGYTLSLGWLPVT